jgi:NADPH:quinone reductase-like Zn-dependent oxidoreductase
MKAYRLHEPSLDGLLLAEEPMPEPAARQAVIRIRAVALNYKDLLFVRPESERGIRLSRPTIPLSDAAGEVVAVGDAVTQFRVGDLVTPVVVQDWFSGPLPADAIKRALGVGVDGVLAQFGVYDEHNLVPVPDHLTFLGGCTLPIAGVTAWNALQDLRAHQTVLVLGTGGVAIFAVQFAKACGARILLITSSDDKAERARMLGVDATINYCRFPEWHKQVLDLTDGLGVDHVVETVGGSSMGKSVAATRIGGSVHQVGLIDRSLVDVYDIQYRAVTVRGIRMGSREQFITMNALIERHHITPVIDQVFPFDEPRDAYSFLESGKHFGKVVIAID